MTGHTAGNSRWSIAHSLAGKPITLFTLEIAGGEIFMVRAPPALACTSVCADLCRKHCCVCAQYQGADESQAICSM